MMRSMSGYGYGRSITASTTVKIAVVAPMPSASVSITTAVKPGFFRSARSAQRTSLVTLSTGRTRIDASSSTSGDSRRIASSCVTPFARSAWYSSSRCWRISSLMPRGQSGIVDSSDPVDGFDELTPRAPLRGEHGGARLREPVVPPAALARLFDPAALNPAAFLEAIEQRIERRDAELQDAARTRLDQLAQVVAVPRLVPDQRQDQQLPAAPFWPPGRESPLPI